MNNYKLQIEYNGARFCGWQKQEGKRTVQGELENAFLTLTGENVTVDGSGRTDSGVHALGQVATAKTSKNIPPNNLTKALNDLLASDVRVCKATKVDESFHARFSAKRKTYEYVVQVSGKQSAITHDLLCFHPCVADFDRMKEAANLLIGKHNFKGFCSAHTNVQSFEREIFEIKIQKSGKKIKFFVTGNGFLYNMVRIIVGTLLEVGSGKRSLEDVKKALDLGERKYAGKTMPPCGLYLKKVEYEKK